MSETTTIQEQGTMQKGSKKLPSEASSAPTPSPRSHDFITTLVATLNIPPYSMLLCMALFGCLLYASIDWSWGIYLRSVLMVYLMHAVLWDRTAQSPTKTKWVQAIESHCKKNIWFRLTAKYFSCKLHPPTTKNPALLFPADQAYIFAYHPHGIIGMGANLALSTDACGFHSIFPGIRRSGVTLNVTFRVPFFKDWLLMNGFCSANKSTLLSRLSGGGDDSNKEKESIVLVPGGAVEALHCKPKTMRLAIRNRKGFIKLALESKAAIVPCIGFGENDIFDTIYMGDDQPQLSGGKSDNNSHVWNARNLLWKLQRAGYKMFSFSTPLWTHLVPLPHPIDVVVGEPMVFSGKTDQPTVEECHARYLKALQVLYDKHKAKYGYDDVPLEFV